MSATPMYEHVEFVRNPDALWGKIESKWDWLGVKPDGQFVVGYPRRPERMHLSATGTVIRDGAGLRTPTRRPGRGRPTRCPRPGPPQQPSGWG